VRKKGNPRGNNAPERQGQRRENPQRPEKPEGRPQAIGKNGLEWKSTAEGKGNRLGRKRVESASWTLKKKGNQFMNSDLTQNSPKNIRGESFVASHSQSIKGGGLQKIERD